jgi:hypothetical protein
VGGGGGSFVKIKEYGTRWVGERGGELLAAIRQKEAGREEIVERWTGRIILDEGGQWEPLDLICFIYKKMTYTNISDLMRRRTLG